MLRLTDSAPFPADRLPRDRTLREALAAALAGEPTEPTEITVDGQSMMLTARALGDGGAVLAVFDLTASRRVEAVRRDFVANVSHELKTPLTVILGFAETLAAGDVPPAQRHAFREAIQSNARRMQQIVDDLLDLSRIESGGWVPNPVAVDLRAVASEVSAGRLRAALEKGVRLSVEIPQEAETAFADPTAIRQVFANLADNAIRHTNAGSIVMFSERAERGTTIGVRDTGVGIAPEHLVTHLRALLSRRLRRARATRAARDSASRSCDIWWRRTGAGCRCRAPWARGRRCRRSFRTQGEEGGTCNGLHTNDTNKQHESNLPRNKRQSRIGSIRPYWFDSRTSVLARLPTLSKKDKEFSCECTKLELEHFELRTRIRSRPRFDSFRVRVIRVKPLHALIPQRKLAPTPRRDTSVTQ